MKKVITGLLVAVVTAAIAVPMAVAGGGNSDAANACKQDGWQNLVRQDGTGFKNQGDCVSYAVQGGVLKTKPTGGEQLLTLTVDGKEEHRDHDGADRSLRGHRRAERNRGPDRLRRLRLHRRGRLRPRGLHDDRRNGNYSQGVASRLSPVCTRRR